MRSRCDPQTERMTVSSNVRESGLFVVGIVMAVGAAALMVWSSISIAPLVVIGVIGIVFIAVGARRRRHS